MNLWGKLEMRLKQVSNDNHKNNPNSSDQCCLLSVTLIRPRGRLLGWLRPTITPIEPVNFILPGTKILTWQEVVESLNNNHNQHIIIRKGLPVDMIEYNML